MFVLMIVGCLSSHKELAGIFTSQGKAKQAAFENIKEGDCFTIYKAGVNKYADGAFVGRGGKTYSDPNEGIESEQWYTNNEREYGSR